MKPVLAVSLGDPAGIGAEILVEAAAMSRIRRACRLAVFGDRLVLEHAARVCGLARSDPSAICELIEVTHLRFRGSWPKAGRSSGRAAFHYLECAAAAVLQGRFAALVTAPINKLWMHRAGYPYDGHTGYLSALTGKHAVMMLAGRRLRVVLVTTHVAHGEVGSMLSAAAIKRTARVTAAHLKRYYGIREPRLAVAALNPHAGEGGLFGSEERRVIRPAVRALQRAGFSVEGPLPADTLFAAAATGHYDAVVCMYHDQALIPLKLLEFGRAVNVSMGLPLLRTSPDHGTAYELAGTGKARPGSMACAIVEAARMVRNRDGGMQP